LETKLGKYLDQRGTM